MDFPGECPPPPPPLHTPSNEFTDKGKSGKTLNDLPNEILLQIFSHVDTYREDRILGHIPDDPPPNPPDAHLIEDFLINSENLCNLALTCKRFRPLAQEQLLYAPIIGGSHFEYPSEPTKTRIVGLIRALLAHGDRKQDLKQLRLCFPFYETDYTNYGGFREFLKQARDMLDNALNIPSQMKERWRLQMDLGFERACFDLLLALRPQLERLCISQSPYSTASQPEVDLTVHNLFGLGSERSMDVDVEDFQGLTVAHSLTYLKVVSRVPLMLVGLDVFPNLRTLDISTKLANHSRETMSVVSYRYSSPDIQEAFHNIRQLRLDFQIKTVGIWDIGARVLLQAMLQSFLSLKTLDCYAESSDSKNPFRSFRAFPHYQANIQNYPDVSTGLDANVESQVYWDQRLYDARTEITDYQNLVDTIVHLRPQLESLRLPGGFWALPGGMRKPLPRFDGFAQLRRLIVPQAAIISIKLDNMRFDDVSGDFELSPLTVLPPLLQYLKIFDADVSLLESRWLQELFIEQKNCNRWPCLEQIEVLFGSTYGDVELEELLARKRQQTFWTWADEASFEVVVGRDDEVPSVYV